MSKLPETMKAVKVYGPKDYRVEEVKTPVPAKEEVVIKIGSCGICGSDVKVYYGSDLYWAGDDPWMKSPVIPGHEFYGTVVALGEGAEDKHGVKMGDRITTDQIKPCGKCVFCETGRYWMCEVHNMYGFQKDVAEGGMAEYMKIYPTSKIYKIDDEISEEEAAIIEPLACAIHTVQRASIEFEDVVVLAGAGTLGLCIVQLVQLKTPKKLIVLETNEKRMELAKNFGADLILNPKEVDVVKEVKDLTGGYGCDVYIEATGSPVGVTQGLDMIRRLGRFVEMSVFGEHTTADWSIIGDKKELDLLGSHLGPYCYPIAIDLLKRKLISVEGIVTDTFNIGEFPQAFERAQDPQAIKVLLKP